MKKVILPLVLCFILLVVVYYITPITTSIVNILDKDATVTVNTPNEYYRDYDFEFVQNTTDFKPYSYQQVLNIFYTFLNSGWTSFTFYCPDEYVDCLDDIKTISDDNVLLTHINNFVHPFNSFTNIKTSYYESGEVTLEIKKLYSEDDIVRINQKVDEIIGQYITPNMSDEEKIRVIHDYIINSTRYDQQRNKTDNSPYASNTAIGPLFQGYAICSGYADVMEIFLERFNIKSFKVASDLHVWNSVFIDNTWKQLDLTWDDPITNTGQDYIYHKYFLVDAAMLPSLDTETNEHDYDPTVYLEI